MDLVRTYPEPEFEQYDRDVTYQHYDGRLIAHQDEGVMLRVALPIALDTGQTAVLGVWIVVHQFDQSRALDRLDSGWDGCTFRGFLVNVVEPWPEVYGAEVNLEAADGPVLARIVSTEHEVLRRVLAEKWPQHLVLGAGA